MAFSGRIIVLKGDPIVKEAKANVAGILPGHRLLLDSAGDTGPAGVATEQDPGRKAFAVEADVIGQDATTAYIDNEQVKYVVAKSGDEILIRATAALTWAIGDPLYAAAAGRVGDIPLSTGVAAAPIGFALSANAAAAVDSLHAMEVA
mgnify:CR=1 FL=1|tara:strand:- start:1174 stop:1617 length:444 start_codon:yes stop_codon:yes gene_type:complete